MIQRSLLGIALLGCLVISQSARADLLSASTMFLEMLSVEHRAQAVHPFNSEERLNWHFIPKKRLGPSYNDLSDSQDKFLRKIIETGLGASGYKKAETIRALEGVLREMEKAAHRDTEDYHILFFGEPSADGNWTVRYEGHHMSFSWTFVGGKLVSSSPQFLGSNPAEVHIDGPMKGVRALAAEEDIAHALVTSLNAEQRGEAIIGTEVPRDIFTANAQKASRQDDIGIPYAKLNASQQGVLISLIEESARVQPDAVAKQRLDKIRKAGLDALKFAWIGGTEKSDPHYYRVQGPTFLIEYDKIQNDANHIHVVWRDFDGDFGADILQQHHSRFADPDHPHVHRH